MGLIFSAPFDRYPKLRLVIGHMGKSIAAPALLMQTNAEAVFRL